MTTPASPQTQLEFWNSAAAQRWADHYDSLDRALKPFSEASLLKAAARTGERALDVGTGCGETLLALAERVGPTGQVCGVDISAPMLARARERSKSLPQASIIEADAGAHKFDPSFDLIYSRFGVMFFEDPLAAFKNLRAALKPNGRIVFVCWRPPQENPWFMLPVMIVKKVWPEAPAMPPADGPGPFAFADPDRVLAILEGAGFAQIAIDRFDAEVALGSTSAESVEFAFRVGPASRMLSEAPDEVRQRVTSELAKALEPYCKDGRCALLGSTWIVSARAA
jgi:SAM-dependent methyltransferase